jgi:purine-binding chemotaxis protein CheW
MDGHGTGREGVMLGDSGTTPVLVVTVGQRECAIPLQYVAETMRPLSIEPVVSPHAFVRGVSVIRGAAMPVVDLARLLGGGEHNTVARRFVTVKVDERRAALAVEAVVGVRDIELARFQSLPPLLRHVGTEVVEAIGSSDVQLLLVLRAARLIPDEPVSMPTTDPNAQ